MYNAARKIVSRKEKNEMLAEFSKFFSQTFFCLPLIPSKKIWHVNTYILHTTGF